MLFMQSTWSRLILKRGRVEHEAPTGGSPWLHLGGDAEEVAAVKGLAEKVVEEWDSLRYWQEGKHLWECTSSCHLYPN